jgi:hypothetical protein
LRYRLLLARLVPIRWEAVWVRLVGGGLPVRAGYLLCKHEFQSR